MLSLLSSCSTRLFLPAIHSSSTPSRVRASSSRLHLSSINSCSQMSSSSTDPYTLPSTTHTPNPDDVLIQYVVLRRDLIDSWPLGSIVTQGCHAAVSAIWIHKDDKNAVDYCSPENIDSMHKVTLEVKGETQIKNLSEKLTASSVDHKLFFFERQARGVNGLPRPLKNVQDYNLLYFLPIASSKIIFFRSSANELGVISTNSAVGNSPASLSAR